MTTGSDALGDRQKLYEQREAGRVLMPLLPILARLDGRGFSSYTRKFEKPFDVRMSHAMVDVTRHLMEESGALVGFTQSDEISLLWNGADFSSEVFFGGKIQKLTSILAAMGSVYFNDIMTGYGLRKLAVFDCRVWNVPTREEAANALLWREQDATKNSVSMAARTLFSDKELFGKKTKEMITMMEGKGLIWEQYPGFFKRGTFLRKVHKATVFSTEELASLPEKHEARRNPGMTVLRSVLEEVDMPPFGRVLNRVEVLFEEAAVEVRGSDAEMGMNSENGKETP